MTAEEYNQTDAQERIVPLAGVRYGRVWCEDGTGTLDGLLVSTSGMEVEFITGDR